MSDANKAVFLSYASQDAEAARRICEALRAAEIEVWFDQSELRGGDAWDQKIRRQIKDCALFVPVISATTQARHEGYFRLEWHLAEQRSHLIARGRPFIVPVSIDQTNDANALVPDAFLAVQWMRLPAGEATPAFCARVKKLLAGDQDAGRGWPPSPDYGAPGQTPPSIAKAGFGDPARHHGEVAASPKKRSLPLMVFGGFAFLLICLMAYCVFKPRRSPEEIARIISEATSLANAIEAKAAAKEKPDAAPPTEARQLVEKARRLFEAPEVTNRENLLLAEQLCNKAVTLDPADAETWAARGQLSYVMRIYGHDSSPARMQLLVSDAERALALAPAAFESRLTSAFSLSRQPARRPEAEKVYRELLQENPTDRRVLRNFGHLMRWEKRDDEAFALYDRAAAVPGGDPIALADKANSFFFLARLPEAERAAAESLAQAPTGRAYLIDTLLKLTGHGDLDGARDSLGHVPPPVLRNNRGVTIATKVWMWRREPQQCLEFLRDVPQDTIEDIYFTGPKAVLTGRAHALAGHDEAARADWESALAQLEKNGQPDTGVVRCELLIRLGRKDEAARLFSRLEQEGGPDWRRNEITAAPLLVLLDRRDDAVALLTEMLNRPRSTGPITRAELRLNPEYDSLRGDPRFQALAREPAEARAPDTTGAAAPDAKSVAVLAFANLSDDKENEYFSDGISEELINVLTKIPGLRVIARTSAFSFKGRNVAVAEIARQLGVAYVIDGSVRKAGNQVRIVTQLINAASGASLWSESYQRELKDVFAIQDEIAGAIAAEFRLKMNGDGSAPANNVDPEAYRLFLAGRAKIHAGGAANRDLAIGDFHQAVAIAPKYAAPWAELARALIQKARAGTTELDPAFAEARAAVRQAVALEPDSPEVLAALGWVRRTADWDWRGAEQAFRRAIALHPNHPDVVAGAAVMFNNLGHVAESIQLGQRAVELDPLNPEMYYNLSFFLGNAGKLAESEHAARRAVELAPQADLFHRNLSNGLADLGRFDEAEREAELEPDELNRLEARALILLRRGRKAEALALAQPLAHGPNNLQDLAELYALAGERDQAFAALEKSYERHETGDAWLKVDSYLVSLYDDPRWNVLLRKTGLADDQLEPFLIR